MRDAKTACKFPSGLAGFPPLQTDSKFIISNSNTFESSSRFDAFFKGGGLGGGNKVKDGDIILEML